MGMVVKFKGIVHPKCSGIQHNFGRRIL